MKVFFNACCAVLLAASIRVGNSSLLRATHSNLIEMSGANDDNDIVDRKGHGSTGKSGYVGISVSASHIAQDPTNWNKAVVVDAVTSAYNNVMDNGFTLSSGFVDKVIEVPEDDNAALARIDAVKYTRRTWADYLLYAGYDCRLCPNYSTLTVLNAIPDPKSAKHQQLEEEVCKNLHATGLQAFSEVQNCNVAFVYSSLTSEEIEALQSQALEKRKSDVHEGTLTAQIQINHVTSTDDGSIGPNNNILRNAWIEAFNTANGNKGMTMKTFRQVREVLMTEDSGNMDNATSLSESIGVTRKYNYDYTWIYGSYDCRLCVIKSDRILALAQLAVNLPAHREFEALLCAKLKESGHPAYKDITACRVYFTYSGDDGIDFLAAGEE